MRPPLALAAVALGAVTLFARAADGDLTFDAVVEQRIVKLGDDAVIVVTVTNHTATAMTVPALRLARDAVSVRITGSGIAPATVTRLYGSFLENERGELDFRPSLTAVRRLGSGESVQGRIAVPAVLAGTITFTAILGEGTPLRVEARPVTVEVPGRQRVAAQVETSKGAFRIDLDAAGAYGGVANFWTLARESYFDGLSFHRVLPGLLAQTGDPRGTGTGGPGWYLPPGVAVAASARGDVGLARGAHPESGASQWFVVTDATSAVAGGYVRLGTVTDGLDVADLITAPPPLVKPARPPAPDRVVSVKPLLR